jgi:vacuolar-type H+-ATPase subunit E/Vma4
MEEEYSGKKLLISGITEDAEIEAGRIVAGAEKKAQELLESAKKRASRLLEDAKARSLDQTERVRARVLGGVEVEVRRRAMMVRENAVAGILEQVREGLLDLRTGPEYRKVLVGWIVEAAIGLGTDGLFVNGSKYECDVMDERLLNESMSAVKKLTGRSVKIGLADSPPLASQGVVARSEDGRTEFNNQIENRLQRKRRVIQQLLYDRLFVHGGEDV